jgi:hypothetical protein
LAVTSLARSSAAAMRRVFAWCVEAERAGDDARIASLIAAVLRQYDRDASEFSDVLELSAQIDSRTARFLRFSYGLPRHRSDAARADAELIALASTLGDGVAAAAEQVARACRGVVVAQPIFGYAHDPPASRAKLYVQFHDAAPREQTAALAERVLQLPIDPALGTLHMIGLDLSESGRLIGAKLYYRRALPPGLVTRIGSQPPDALAIRRIDAPDVTAPIGDAREHDFAVAPPLPAWHELRAMLPFSPGLAPLEAACPLRVRRVSLTVDLTRLTVYYVPA